MKSFLFGLGLGIGLGVLFAPMSGEEARDNIAERANDLASSAKQTIDSAKQTIEHGRERLRTSIGTVRAAGSAGNHAPLAQRPQLFSPHCRRPVTLQAGLDSPPAPALQSIQRMR